MTWSSRVTKTVESLRVISLLARVNVESLRVISLLARVNVESHEISHFFYYIFYAMKWRPTCYKMEPDKLENGTQHVMKWRQISFVSTSLSAGYLYLSFLSLHFTCPFHSQSFQKV